MTRQILALFLIFPSTLIAAELSQRVPSVDELISIQAIRGAVLSPDGRWVAYVLRSADFERDSYSSQLWLVETEGTSPFQLTRGESASNPEWSPDGRWLTFTRTHEGEAQLFVIRPDAGEATRLSAVETGIQTYHWNQQGTKIAFTARKPANPADQARKKHFGEFGVFRKDHDRSQLWALDFREALREPQQGELLTNGDDLHVLDFSWAPDSQTIAFSATTNTDLADRDTADIYLLDLDGQTVTPTVTMPGPDTDPHYSPDGLSISFSTYLGQTRYYASNSHLSLIPAEQSRPLSLTEQLDENPRYIGWTDHGIYFTALQKTRSHLYRVSPATREIVRVSRPDSLMARSFSLSRDGSKLAFVAGSPDSLPEIFFTGIDDFSPRRLTNLTVQIEPLMLASRELIKWKSKDGTEIEGVLMKPADFDPGKTYALLCTIHGGPTGIDRPGLLDRGTSYYPVDIWAARGALILQVNYRGSAGYGESFRQLNMRNLGVGDSWDVLSGVQHLLEKGWVDPARVGCMGWSQGGYISAFLSTSSDRFAAISVGAGISNWATYYYNTDITPFTINYLGDDPIDDPEIYQLTSPMSYIRHARTPTLIQHGEFDQRVPTANAYELRQGLEDREVPVELIIYKGFGHGITKPKAMRAVMQHNLEWFGHYLWDDPLPDFTHPALPEEPEEDQKPES